MVSGEVAQIFITHGIDPLDALMHFQFSNFRQGAMGGIIMFDGAILRDPQDLINQPGLDLL